MFTETAGGPVATQDWAPGVWIPGLPRTWWGWTLAWEHTSTLTACGFCSLRLGWKGGQCPGSQDQSSLTLMQPALNLSPWSPPSPPTSDFKEP